MVSHFHVLMMHMAKLARLSAESMSDFGQQNPECIFSKGEQIHDELITWWASCPPQLRDQSTDWRRKVRPKKLTVPETLEEEAFSSTKSCMQGCIIYLNHILDPLGAEPQPLEVKDAIFEILEIAKETPEGYGLEMGLYWGLFMAGVATFNDEAVEALIRVKLKADKSISIYVSAQEVENGSFANASCSMRIELSICSKCCGKDSINTGRSTTGVRFRSRWASKCKFLIEKLCRSGVVLTRHRFILA